MKRTLCVATMKTSVSRLRSMPMLLLPPLSTPTRARSRCAIAPPHARLPALARQCVIVLHQRFNCCLMARASSALTKQPTGQTNLESSPRHRPAAGIFSQCTHTAQPSTTKVQHAHPLLANKLAGESRVIGEERLSV